MPVFVTTQVGEKLSDIVAQYQSVTNHSSTKNIEEIANLNNVSSTKILSPFKILVLPDASSNGSCNTLDYQAAALARSMAQEKYDPLKTLLQTGWGNELLASLEIVESLQADGEVKAVFGGALGASNNLYNQFLSANDRYKDLLKTFASVGGAERNALRQQIRVAAKEVEQQYQKVVAVFVKGRRGSLPKRWKEVPHVHMDHVKNRGKGATILKDSADIRRIRYVANSARMLGAGALLLDIGLAGKNIKQAYDTGGNTTRVAFEEIGGVIVAAVGAGFGLTIATYGVAAVGAFFPFLLIPGVGLLIAVGIGAAGALIGNIQGKKLGNAIYYNYVSPINQGSNFDSLKAL